MKTVHTIPAGEFKERCLALLDEVNDSGDELVITKRGRPVARVVPVREPETGDLLGSVVWEEDLVRPVGLDWAATRSAYAVDRPNEPWPGGPRNTSAMDLRSRTEIARHPCHHPPRAAPTACRQP